jgi:hypothetical protein
VVRVSARAFGCAVTLLVRYLVGYGYAWKLAAFPASVPPLQYVYFRLRNRGRGD